MGLSIALLTSIVFAAIIVGAAAPAAAQELKLGVTISTTGQGATLVFRSAIP